MHRLFLTIILLLFIGVPPTLSATTQEVDEVFEEGRNICALVLQKCTFKRLELDLPLASTTYNDITVVSGVYNRLTKDELRAIVYHEVAHAISDHSEKGQKVYNRFFEEYKRYPTAEELQPIKYKFENEADTLAVLMLYGAKKPILLDTALVKVTSPYGNGQASKTHPSVETRVRHIQSLKNKLGVY